LPIAYLNQVLGLKSDDRDEAVSMVVLQAEDRQFGLVVDGINDTQEIVVKPLGKQLKGLTLYAGATIMGDGRVALILDVLGIGQCSGVFGEAREAVRSTDKQKVQAENEQQRLLLFQSGSFHRLAVPLSLVARLEEFPRSVLEHAGGEQVVQYRGRILPLVSLRSILEPNSAVNEMLADPVQVVVFNDGDVSVGMVVDQILDVAEEAVTVRQSSDRKGLLGSAVVRNKVTDFLDLNEVIHAMSGIRYAGADERSNYKKILLLESSIFTRGTIRASLEMAGYSVIEATNLDEATHKLEEQMVAAVLAELDIQSDGSSPLLAVMRGRSEWSGIPALALVEPEEVVRASAARAAGFRDCQSKFDRVLVLASVARMVS
jgi:two-component system chemotaxis sensor kinase CheA